MWCEPDATRLTWITMLAKSDRKGRVFASIPGLANVARVSVEGCEKALNTFLNPDKYSRNKKHEGRRIEPIDGGWRLLNYEEIREMRDEESVRESKREWARKNRLLLKEKADKSDTIRINGNGKSLLDSRSKE